MNLDWLAVSLPMLAASGAVLFASVRGTVAAWRGDRLRSLPLTGEHVVDLPEPGAYVLRAVGPCSSRAFRGLDCEIRAVDDDEAAPLGRARFAFRIDGLVRALAPLRRFVVRRPGRYRLVMKNQRLDPDLQGCELLVMRAKPAKLALNILGIVAAGYFASGSLFVTLLALAGALP